ncbi:ABC transporter ATP-binding protein [Corallococcus macrosporus]|uniref:ABC transporter n=1 Tax=Myxococcus fulvus (strain ATCC BAA-855 / HW-1) TaxID=483219 RepID=F8C8J3_MYXFH|nr:ABC transporter ATP-binding protein [Corallococcus macrosporus]AEI62039.1 ABC transporter [Corallococcus macrosporus]
MQTPPVSRGSMWRALGYLRPYRRTIAFILLLVLTSASLSALEPLVLKGIFDQLGSEDATKPVLLGVGLLVLMGLLREALGAASNWLTWRTRIQVHFALNEATVSRLHRLPLSFHRQEGVGALMTRMDRGLQGFVGAITELTFNVIPAAVYLCIAVAVMLRLDWRLALLALAFAPLPVLIARRAAPVQARREETLLERWTQIYARFNEVLSGILTVKSFAMEDREKQRFLHGVRDANAVVTRGVAFDSAVTAGQNTTVLVARVASICMGGLLVMKGQLTVGTLVAFLGYIGGLFGPVQGLSGVYKTLRTASVAIRQVFSILDAQDSLGDAPDAHEVTHMRGDVTFEDVHFAYPSGAGRPLINGISLNVRRGETVALVGPSGAGKTTLMSLLCRFYDPDQGVVRVDGRDIRTLKQLSLRRNIGVVLQDALLFNESVKGNIAYGRPHATDAEIEAAARAAHAHEFILGLPQGYDTLVGERGSRLSAGERQRIAIARSLLTDPPILILDEPTSALDAESEALVQDALGELMKGRTTFAIAHRLSTVVSADRILVLKDGRLIEEGTHAELLRRDGYYASLVRKQTRGLLPELPAPPLPATPVAA